MSLPMGYKLGKFEIKQVLGKGGFGITYLVMHTGLKKEMVIKEFFPKDLVDRDDENSTVSLKNIDDDNEKYELNRRRYKYFLKKFEDEAKIMASIDHPNIVKVHDIFKENNTQYFVMDYIKGESLKKYIKREGGLNQERIMEIIMPILEGLKAVHNKNLLHRDIAPDNIFLTQKGKAMLLDFGAAKSTIRDDDGTEVSIGVVKKGYSAPEQYSDDSIHTISTDLYAVGAVIVFLITAKMPPEATARLTLVSSNERDSLEVLLEKYSSRYTQGFIKAILRVMSLDEKSRFQEIKSFQDALITKRVSLKSYILNSNKKLNKKELLEKINPLLDKLEKIHTEGKTHSNISPESIYIKDGNKIELGRPMEAISSSSKSLTAIRNIGYSAPEQYSMNSKDTKQTDIYSVGAIIIFMMSGKVPTEATKRQTDIYSGEKDPIKKILDGYRDRYSDEFLKAILKAMKLNPNDRFQDIMLFRETLNREDYEFNPPISVPISLKKIAILVSVLLIFGIGVYFIIPKSHDNDGNLSKKEYNTTKPVKQINKQKKDNDNGSLLDSIK